MLRVELKNLVTDGISAERWDLQFIRSFSALTINSMRSVEFMEVTQIVAQILIWQIWVGSNPEWQISNFGGGSLQSWKMPRFRPNMGFFKILGQKSEKLAISLKIPLLKGIEPKSAIFSPKSPIPPPPPPKPWKRGIFHNFGGYLSNILLGNSLISPQFKPLGGGGYLQKYRPGRFADFGGVPIWFLQPKCPFGKSGKRPIFPRENPLKPWERPPP
jgi:hypothetical protein